MAEVWNDVDEIIQDIPEDGDTAIMPLKVCMSLHVLLCRKFCAYNIMSPLIEHVRRVIPPSPPVKLLMLWARWYMAEMINNFKRHTKVYGCANIPLFT